MNPSNSQDLRSKIQDPGLRSQIYIVGPTASGKTKLAIQIAKKYNGEIICADSRTVYRGLDIATAKPTPAEQQGVKHWGLDLVFPNQRFTAADFKNYATAKISDINSRGRLPIVVGGSGLYIDGLLFDYDFGPDLDPKMRAELEQKSAEELLEIITINGIEKPNNFKNKRHLVRAIEQGGINRSHKTPKVGQNLVIGLNPGIDELQNRIAARAEQMLKAGALDEARQLFMGYGYEAPAAAAPFYKAYKAHFEQLAASIEDCQKRHLILERQLAKRQIIWFKRNPNIHWFETPESALDFMSNCYSLAQ